jgi:hypothetical protein
VASQGYVDTIYKTHSFSFVINYYETKVQQYYIYICQSYNSLDLRTEYVPHGHVIYSSYEPTIYHNSN